jgi:hypothetical protein
LTTEYTFNLPKYLSDDNLDSLFSDLKEFPIDYEKKFYSFYMKKYNDLLQGDGVKVPYYDINSKITKDIPCMILSNTCSISLENPGNEKSNVLIAPILKLDLFIKELEKKGKKGISDYINKVKNQKVNDIFFLPKINDNFPEAVVLFSKIINCKNTSIDRNEIDDIKYFTLSNTGFYILLYKISYFFSRMSEGLDRNS